MDIDKLRHIGLNDKESKVYLALIEFGDSLVSEIAEKTRINRSLLYDVLSDLADKGMVTYILKNNVRHYRAAEPEKILSMIREKENVFKAMLPELMALHKPQTKKPIVEILEGKEGIKTILNDIIRLKKDWVAFDVPGKGPEILGVAAEAFENERQKARISFRAICVRTEAGLKRGKEFSKMRYTTVRYLPRQYTSPASNYIYGDRIAIIFWYKESPFAIRIIDSNLAESYKSNFEMMWKASMKE